MTYLPSLTRMLQPHPTSPGILTLPQIPTFKPTTSYHNTCISKDCDQIPHNHSVDTYTHTPPRCTAASACGPRAGSPRYTLLLHPLALELCTRRIWERGGLRRDSWDNCSSVDWRPWCARIEWEWEFMGGIDEEGGYISYSLVRAGIQYHAISSFKVGGLVGIRHARSTM